MESFILWQISDYPLICMFHNRHIEKRVNRLYDGAFSLVCDDSKSLSFKDVLRKDNSVSIRKISNYLQKKFLKRKTQ